MYELCDTVLKMLHEAMFASVQSEMWGGGWGRGQRGRTYEILV